MMMPSDLLDASPFQTRQWNLFETAWRLWPNSKLCFFFLLRRKFYISFHHSHHDKDCSQRFTPDVMELIRIMVLTCVMEYRVKSCYGVSWCTDHLHGSQALSA